MIASNPHSNPEQLHAAMLNPNQTPYRQIALGEMTDVERFADFHAFNPHIYTEMVQVAHTLRAEGYTRYSMGKVAALVRKKNKSMSGGKSWGVANTNLAYYARLIMIQEEGLRGFFAVICTA